MLPCILEDLLKMMPCLPETEDTKDDDVDTLEVKKEAYEKIFKESLANIVGSITDIISLLLIYKNIVCRAIPTLENCISLCSPKLIPDFTHVFSPIECRESDEGEDKKEYNPLEDEKFIDTLMNILQHQRDVQIPEEIVNRIRKTIDNLQKIDEKENISKTLADVYDTLGKIDIEETLAKLYQYIEKIKSPDELREKILEVLDDSENVDYIFKNLRELKEDLKNLTQNK